MEIQKLKSPDLEEVLLLKPEGWHNFLSSLQFYTTSDFCFPIKIVLENKIIGIGTAILHYNVAWLAQIIVHPDHRGKGLGKFITQKLIEIANSHNCKTIELIATDLGFPVYEKLGFITESEYLLFKGKKIDSDLPDNENIISYSENLIKQIKAMDMEISAENRFEHLSTYLQSGYYFVENTTLIGFYLPDFGEGLIIAMEEMAGIELLKIHISKNEMVILPSENNAAITYLLNNCFKNAGSAKRMYLGKKLNWNAGKIFNRIGGNLG